jgi:hypothetical protein
MGLVCLWINFNVFVHSYSCLRLWLSAFQMERTNLKFLLVINMLRTSGMRWTISPRQQMSIYLVPLMQPPDTSIWRWIYTPHWIIDQAWRTAPHHPQHRGDCHTTYPPGLTSFHRWKTQSIYCLLYVGAVRAPAGVILWLRVLRYEYISSPTLQPNTVRPPLGLPLPVPCIRFRNVPVIDKSWCCLCRIHKASAYFLRRFRERKT